MIELVDFNELYNGGKKEVKKAKSRRGGKAKKADEVEVAPVAEVNTPEVEEAEAPVAEVNTPEVEAEAPEAEVEVEAEVEAPEVVETETEAPEAKADDKTAEE
jgi:large subunit ribosomal protein L17